MYFRVVEPQYFVQGLEAAVVHVGRGFGDVPQRGGAVGSSVVRVTSDRRTVVRVGGLCVQSVVVEQVGGEQRAACAAVAVEAVGTLLGGEEDVAVQLLRGELLLASQVTVELGVAGDERAHILRDGFLDTFHRDFFASECFLEQRRILAVGFDGGHGTRFGAAHLVIGGDGHQDDILNGALFRVRIVVGNQTVPEVAFVVEDEVHERHDVVYSRFARGAAFRFPIGEARVFAAEVVVALAPMARSARHQRVGIYARVAAEVWVVEEHTA